MRPLGPKPSSTRVSLNLLALCCALGCASGTGESPDGDGAGGTTATGGASGSGGTSGSVASGGSAGTAGTAGTASGKGGSGSVGGTTTGSGGSTPAAGSGGSATSGGASSTGGSPGSGGSTTSGGSSSTGGASGVGASPGSGGTGGSGSSTSGSGGESGGGEQPDVGPAPCGCTSPAGEYGTIDETIVVRSGEVWDGQCKIVRANPNTVGDGTQAEGQDPVFVIEDGGTLRNVILGASAADGVHVEGDATLENVHWQDIGEDAMTIEGSGTVNLNCGSAQNGDDKVFQVNAASTLNVTNFTARNAGKFVRQNGGTTFTINVNIDHCDISDMGEVIFRTDSGSSHVTLTNSRYSDIADGLFMFGSSVVDGNSDQSTVSNNSEY